MSVVGGFPVGADGRVHTTFTHNPSTLRLSSVDPNLQNIPRGGGYAKWVKECFVAPAGSQFWARDFSGIEAVLVGYFAGDRDYLRLAKIDVHTFYTTHALYLLEQRLPASDLPNLSASDADLTAHLAALKKVFKEERNALFKHLVHGANYLQSARGAQEKIFKETSTQYEEKQIKRCMDAYFELFPAIRNWQKDICIRVDRARRRDLAPNEKPDPWSLGVAHVTNPFGYVHRFYHVLDWQKINNQWVWSFGEDAKRLVAFFPQSTASALLKQAGRILWTEFPEVGTTMRLWIHDEIFGESEDRQTDHCLTVSKTVMERPCEYLPLDPAWEMGPYLNIITEGKVGQSWGDMRGVA